MGSNGTHKNKTYLSKERNSKVHIRIGKCIWKNRQPPLKSKLNLMSNNVLKCSKCARMRAFWRIFAHCSVTVTRTKFCFFVCWFCGTKALLLTTINFDFKAVCRFFQMHFPMRICTIEFFSFDKYVLFLWVPLEPIWFKLIFNIFGFSAHPTPHTVLWHIL